MRLKSTEYLKQLIHFPDHNGCWNWKGPFLAGGYGSFRGRRAHRVVYEFFYGLVPETNNWHPARTQWVLHKCNNPRCVNPEHLYIGTPKDNTRDAMEAGHRSRSPHPVEARFFRLLSDRNYSLEMISDLTGFEPAVIYHYLRPHSEGGIHGY